MERRSDFEQSGKLYGMSEEEEEMEVRYIYSPPTPTKPKPPQPKEVPKDTVEEPAPPAPRKKKRSKFRDVHWHHSRKEWYVQRIGHSIQFFADEQEAALWADTLLRRDKGNLRELNFDNADEVEEEDSEEEAEQVENKSCDLNTSTFPLLFPPHVEVISDFQPNVGRLYVPGPCLRARPCHLLEAPRAERTVVTPEKSESASPPVPSPTTSPQETAADLLKDDFEQKRQPDSRNLRAESGKPHLIMPWLEEEEEIEVLTTRNMTEINLFYSLNWTVDKIVGVFDAAKSDTIRKYISRKIPCVLTMQDMTELHLFYSLNWTLDKIVGLFDAAKSDTIRNYFARNVPSVVPRKKRPLEQSSRSDFEQSKRLRLGLDRRNSRAGQGNRDLLEEEEEKMEVPYYFRNPINGELKQNNVPVTNSRRRRAEFDTKESYHRIKIADPDCRMSQALKVLFLPPSVYFQVPRHEFKRHPPHPKQITIYADKCRMGTSGPIFWILTCVQPGKPDAPFVKIEVMGTTASDSNLLRHPLVDVLNVQSFTMIRSVDFRRTAPLDNVGLCEQLSKDIESVKELRLDDLIKQHDAI